MAAKPARRMETIPAPLSSIPTTECAVREVDAQADARGLGVEPGVRLGREFPERADLPLAGGCRR